MQRILTKASRRNARRRLQNAYMTLKRLVEKYHEDMMRRRMAASKLRKIIWRRLLRRKKKVLLVLRRMGSEPYVVKLQWAYRRRLWGRHARARYIQNYYRRYRAVCLAQKRKSSIRSVATAFVLNVCLPPCCHGRRQRLWCSERGDGVKRSAILPLNLYILCGGFQRGDCATFARQCAFFAKRPR